MTEIWTPIPEGHRVYTFMPEQNRDDTSLYHRIEGENVWLIIETPDDNDEPKTTEILLHDSQRLCYMSDRVDDTENVSRETFTKEERDNLRAGLAMLQLVAFDQPERQLEIAALRRKIQP